MQGAAQRVTVEEQAMTMTRSLGDFYSHRFGGTDQAARTIDPPAALPSPTLALGSCRVWTVSCVPEVTTLELSSLAASRGWRGARLLLASDGVWDLWELDALAEQVAKGGGAGEELGALSSRLREETRAMGEEYFGERADNLTGVLVDLEEVMRLGGGAAAAKTGTRSSAAGRALESTV